MTNLNGYTYVLGTSFSPVYAYVNLTWCFDICLRKLLLLPVLVYVHFQFVPGADFWSWSLLIWLQPRCRSSTTKQFRRTHASRVWRFLSQYVWRMETGSSYKLVKGRDINVMSAATKQFWVCPIHSLTSTDIVWLRITASSCTNRK